MNFLAHLYLGRHSPDYMLGNLLGDFVKGNDYRRYKPEIQAGIIAHRKVDTYTDQHPVFIRSTRRLGDEFHLLKGVIVDVFYDHFLAVHWQKFAEVPLEDFAADSYHYLQSKDDILPARLKRMLPYMVSGNWLVAYRDLAGIQQAMNGMSRRIKRDNHMSESVAVLRQKYARFEADFMEFFPQLIEFAETLKPTDPNGL